MPTARATCPTWSIPAARCGSAGSCSSLTASPTARSVSRTQKSTICCNSWCDRCVDGPKTKDPMTERTIHPVILCGGSGTRLWPKSRKAKPKPFLALVGERTLFEATLDRWLDEEHFAEAVIVAGEAHLPHIAEQAGDGATVIVEPQAKN